MSTTPRLTDLGLFRLFPPGRSTLLRRRSVFFLRHGFRGLVLRLRAHRRREPGPPPSILLQHMPDLGGNPVALGFAGEQHRGHGFADSRVPAGG
jgi:hypothetical protein